MQKDSASAVLRSEGNSTYAAVLASSLPSAAQTVERGDGKNAELRAEARDFDPNLVILKKQELQTIVFHV